MQQRLQQPALVVQIDAGSLLHLESADRAHDQARQREPGDGRVDGNDLEHARIERAPPPSRR